VERSGGLPPRGSRAVLPGRRDRTGAASGLAGQADLRRLPGPMDVPGVGAAALRDRRHLGRQHAKRAARAARSPDSSWAEHAAGATPTTHAI